MGIALLIIMAVFTFELAYTLLNPHMFYTAKSMAEMMIVIVPSGIIGFLLVNYSIKGREKQILFQKDNSLGTISIVWGNPVCYSFWKWDSTEGTAFIYAG